MILLAEFHYAKEELTKTAEAKKVDFDQKLEETISNMSYKADDIISALEKKLADLKSKERTTAEVMPS